MVTTEEYRKLLGDTESTDEEIIARLKYLEAFCRNIIRAEIEAYQTQIMQPAITTNEQKENNSSA